MTSVVHGSKQEAGRYLKTEDGLHWLPAGQGRCRLLSKASLGHQEKATLSFSSVSKKQS